MKKEYLSYEEQFKENINRDEISHIEDNELRHIRDSYWLKRHKAFLDEGGIPDEQLAAVTADLIAQEQAELAEYKKRRGLK